MAYRYKGGVDDERMNVFLETLYGDRSEHLRMLEEYADRIHAPIMRLQTAELIRFFLCGNNVKKVLEIGTAIGYSALFMLDVKKDIRIDTIEKVPARINDARANFEKYDKNRQITLYEGDAKEVLRRLSGENKEYEFVFLDAAKAQYMNYIQYIEKMIVTNGILITDNVLQEGALLESRYAVNRRDRTIHSRMREYLKYITNSEEWNTVILPIGDGVAVSTRLV